MQLVVASAQDAHVSLLMVSQDAPALAEIAVHRLRSCVPFVDAALDEVEEDGPADIVEALVRVECELGVFLPPADGSPLSPR